MKLGHRLHRLLAVLALGACAALLVACGGGGSSCSGGSSANDLLKQTFSCSHTIKSGNIALTFNINAPGSKQLKGPISAQFNGPFQSLGKGKLPKFDFTVFVSAQGKRFNAGAVSTGSNGFLRYQGTTYSVPPSVFDQFRSGFEQAASKSTASKNKKSGLSRFGIDPIAWLKNPHVVGTESVAGAETKHISAQVDVSKLLDDINTLLGKAGSLGIPNATQLPKSITPAQRTQIQQAVKTATFDVYTGSSDHTLRKLAINLVINAASLSSTSSSTAGLSNLQIAFTFQIAGLNQAQTVTAPTGARPLSELTSKLGSLSSALGGAAGGAGSTGSSGTGTTPASPNAGNVQKYSKCLQSAGGDISKAQQCAKLLTSK